MTKTQAQELLAAIEAGHRLATNDDAQYTQGIFDGRGQLLAILRIVVNEMPDDGPVYPRDSLLDRAQRYERHIAAGTASDGVEILAAKLQLALESEDRDGVIKIEDGVATLDGRFNLKRVAEFIRTLP